MRNDACRYATDEGAGKTSGDEVSVAKRVKCGSIGTEKSAPAHSHCCKDGYRIAVDDAFAHHLGNKTKCSTNRSKGCNGKGNTLTRIEAKEPSEDEVNFASQKRQ